MPIGWRVIEPPVEATIQAKTKKLGFNAQGQQPAMGPMYTLLKKRAASFNGRVDPAGGIATSTKKSRMSAIGSQTHLGGMNVSVKKPTFIGTQINQGQMAPSIKKTIAAVSGRQTFQGALGAALKKAVDSLTGAQTHTGTMAAAVKKAKAALVGTVPGVMLNALGTYTANPSSGTGNSSNMSAASTITVASGANTRMYAIVTVCHNAWVNSYNTNKPAVTSSINGAFTLVDSGWLGNVSGWRQGSIWIFEYIGPSAAAHTVTANVTASQNLNGISVQTIAFDGVVSRGTITKTTNPPNTGAADLTVSALADSNVHLIIQTDNAGSGATLTNDWPSDATRFINNYTTWANGDARSMRCCYAKGTGSSKRFTTGTNSQYALLSIPLLSS